MKTKASQGPFWLTSLSLPNYLHSFIKIPPFLFNKGTCTGLGISRADLNWEDHLFLLAPYVPYGSGDGFQWATLEVKKFRRRLTLLGCFFLG
jgi:hypothetical protein